jgi:hypothetical protein
MNDFTEQDEVPDITESSDNNDEDSSLVWHPINK